MITKLASIGLSVILIFGVLCATGAAQTGPLAQVIEQAKKEGTVSAKLKSGLTSKSMYRLEKEITEKYGVTLSIKSAPVENMPKDLAQAIMEHKVGATPSYDLMTFGPEHIITGLDAGIFEKVEWSSLLPKEMPREVIVHFPRYGEVGLSCYTSQQGLMYNPQKVAATEVPRTLNELADPKWKGRVGVHTYAPSWAIQALVSGREKVLSNLRAILKNGAIQGSFVLLYNKYLIDEIWMAFLGNSYFKTAQDKGMPAAWQNLEYVIEESRPLAIRKGAAHPNAAKVVAIYLASPAGARFVLEESGGGNAAYPGNFTFDIRRQGKEQGMGILSFDSHVDFYRSDDFKKWQKEIELIFKTGG